MFDVQYIYIFSDSDAISCPPRGIASVLVTQMKKLESEPFRPVMSERTEWHVFRTLILQLKKMRNMEIRSRKFEFRTTNLSSSPRTSYRYPSRCTHPAA